MTVRRTVVITPVLLAACGAPANDSPWLTPDALGADTWGHVCGTQRIPSFVDPRFPDANDVVSWASSSEPGTGVRAQCDVGVDKRTRRPTSLSVSVDWWTDRPVPLAATQPAIERVRAAALAQVAPRYRPWVLLASMSTSGQATFALGEGYLVTGNYDLRHGGWGFAILPRAGH